MCVESIIQIEDGVNANAGGSGGGRQLNSGLSRDLRCQGDGGHPLRKEPDCTAADWRIGTTINNRTLPESRVSAKVLYQGVRELIIIRSRFVNQRIIFH